MVRRILLSLAVIAFAGGVVVGGTGAFFSDEETSVGNVFAAGEIDLGLDNESYYNGQPNAGTSWAVDFDLSDNPARQFFAFNDLKPGDYGEDTISVHVSNNEAWLCADVTLTSDNDVSCTEPELEDDPTCQEPNADAADGELADQINFLWWADDGDNVLEVDETVLPAGALGALGVGNTASVALADSESNIWTGLANSPIFTPDDEDIEYIGKAWCFGAIAATALPVGEYDSPAGDNNNNQEAGEPEDGGYTCSGGAQVSNAAQSDSVTLDVAFRAVQARHNDDFLCSPPRTGQVTVTKVVANDNQGTAEVDDFALFVGAEPVVSGVQEEILAGEYQITETGPEGYTATFSGSGCTSAGVITVPAGGSASCTITNNDNPPVTGTLTVTKVVSNDNGGTLEVIDFPLFVGGNAVTSGVPMVLAPGSYTVTETGQQGYEATYTGDCDAQGNVTLAAGENKSCTITNDDIAPTITLTKVVVEGTASPDDFDPSIDDVVLTSGSSKSVQANTAHVLDEEATVQGYTFTSLTGVSAFGTPCPNTLGGTITLAPGDSVSCVITNTFSDTAPDA